ncbi:MAG: RdgB/HAM1 family non-canonical purine NTP pyrophosphatase [Clostridia bacterium]|nr:RdgB/HAM1 family non-canonical purine NTP pyrophosphatase [Clostridia bacterium]
MNDKKIILASNNAHKIEEIKDIFSEYEILSLKDIGFFEDIEENGKTFLDNAFIKAKTVHDYLKTKNIEAIVLADDSGLCVDALNGEPGVFSARYASNHGDSVENRKKLLHNLKNIKERTAHFVCILVKMYPNGEWVSAEGKTFGEITKEELGDKSFGYDCIFYSYDLNKTFGQATKDEKNSISHRSRALSKIKL